MHTKEFRQSTKAAYLLSFSFLSVHLLTSLGAQDWLAVIRDVSIIVVLALLIWIKMKTEIPVPSKTEIATIVFLFLSIFFGGARNLYDRFWWWDGFVHFNSGIWLSLIGIIIVYVFTFKSRVGVRPFFISLFVFCFAVAAGALWEIFEFFIDLIFETEWQLGMLDINTDLLMDILGALLASVIIYVYLRFGRGSLGELVLDR